MDIEVAISFKLLSLDEDRRDGWVVEGLLEEDRYSSKNALKSFSDDGVEGFLHIGEAGVHEEEGEDNKLHLLDEIGGFDSFSHEVRKESHGIGYCLQHGFIVEDLNGKRHIHD